MSELDEVRLRGLVAAACEGRSTADAIRHIREIYGRELQQATDYLVDKALVLIMQTSARRRATKVLNDGFDLFEEFPARGVRTVEVKDGRGKLSKIRKSLGDLTIAQLRQEIRRLESRSLPRHKEAEVLKSMLRKVEKFGVEETTVSEALQKAHAED